MTTSISPAVIAPIVLFLSFLTVRKLFSLLSFLRVKSILRSIPGPPRPPGWAGWAAGNLPFVYDRENLAWHHAATRAFAQEGEKVAGVVQIHALFGDEQLYVTDPVALHHVLVRQADVFEEPSFLLTLNNACLGEGLLATIGAQHARQRKMLNPVFHIKHMRKLVGVFFDVANRACEAIQTQISSTTSTSEGAEINVHAWLSRASLEFIAQGGLGRSLDTLKDDSISPYAKAIRDLVPSISQLQGIIELMPLTRFMPRWMCHVGVSIGSAISKPIQRLRGVVDTLEEKGREIVEERKVSEGGKEKIEGDSAEYDSEKDILSVLIRENANAPIEERLSDDEIVGQVTTLIFAAADTTSSAVARLLYALASNPSVQDRLRREIRTAKKTLGPIEGWTYDELMALPYLDAVVRETLRMYGPVSWIWRVARKATTLPLLRPLKLTTGEMVDRIPVARNQGVIVGIAASGRDEETWGREGAGAMEWKPERWLDDHDTLTSGDEAGKDEEEEELGLTGGEELKGLRVAKARLPAAYSGMMTFSGGVRGCIGFKFAILAIKVDLATLLDRFTFALPSPTTPEGDEREIVWHMNHIQSPAVKIKRKNGDVENVLSNLPLKVGVAPTEDD
ncbi:cytochrome P450 [Schizopora paradoxa]|uniref:Cytochrome P450 n=1 Tax=Schizopora paradoxa TaxID=27342 RepID=A0A0H2SE59_9AGAM|nr:cytochrome P450 [Schizopora paradoxa]